MNKIVQWQLSPVKKFYQFETIYYGIITLLLQQNNLLLRKVLWQLKPEYQMVMWSASGRRLVGDQLGTDWQLIGARLATVSWTYVYNNKKVYACLETSRQPIGDQSATENRAGIVCTTATGRRTVANQSPTSPRPPCDHQKPFYGRF